MFPSRLSILALAVGLAVAAPLRVAAHEGHHDQHVMGTVAAVDASHVEVKTTDGKTVSVVLTPETKYVQSSGAAAKAETLTTGTRVVIDVEKKGDNLEAHQVHIGKATVKK
jgi:hypothetical protein